MHIPISGQLPDQLCRQPDRRIRAERRQHSTGKGRIEEFRRQMPENLPLTQSVPKPLLYRDFFVFLAHTALSSR